MVLFAICGELGTGKTLSLAYLGWSNWFKKQRQVFSNIDLFGFPFTRVESIPDLDKMKDGVFLGDELWLWVDSWSGRDTKQKLTSSILLKSRRRGITIIYTSQSMSQVNLRIRNITDFVAYPLMSTDNSYCRLEIFRGPNPSISTRINPPIYFNVEPVYAIFNTFEEVKPIENSNTNFKERFLPIESNPAWIRYLRTKGYNAEDIVRISRKVQKDINPLNITSESQRERKPLYEPL